TLTTAAVFFPVTFLYGVSRYLFSALALTVVLALLASYLVAMTIVPLFCRKFIKTPHESAPHKSLFNTPFQKLLNAYDGVHNRILRAPAIIVVASLAIFTASLLIYPRLGVSFFPRTDAGQFVINLKAPSGTNLLVTEKEVAKVEKIVREVVAPEDYGMMVTNIGVVPDFSAIYTSNSAPSTAFLQVSLTDGHKVGSYQYMDRVRERLRREMPHMSAYFQSGGFVDAVPNFGMPAPIDVQVSGPSLDLAHKTATELAAQIRTLPGVKDILIPQDIDSPALRIDFDRLRADQLGLNTK